MAAIEVPGHRPWGEALMIVMGPNAGLLRQGSRMGAQGRRERAARCASTPSRMTGSRSSRRSGCIEPLPEGVCIALPASTTSLRPHPSVRACSKNRVEFTLAQGKRHEDCTACRRGCGRGHQRARSRRRGQRLGRTPDHRQRGRDGPDGAVRSRQDFRLRPADARDVRGGQRGRPDLPLLSRDQAGSQGYLGGRRRGHRSAHGSDLALRGPEEDAR